MAYSRNQFLIFLTTIFITFSSPSLSSLASENNLPASTISAAPALSPADSLSTSPPALSPDTAPLFPSPQLSPTEASLPIIPSSPSPPNPDDDTATALSPAAAFAPSGLLPDSSSPQLNVGGFKSSLVVFGLVAFGILWLSG